MTASDPYPIADRVRQALQAIAALVVAESSAALLAWVLLPGALRDGCPPLRPMAPTTSVLGLLFCVAFWLNAPAAPSARARQVVRVVTLSGALAALGLSLARLFGGRLPSAGGLLSSLCLAMLHVALWSLARRGEQSSWRWFAWALALVVTSIGFVSVLGGALEVPEFFGARLIPPSLSAGVMFMTAGLGLQLLASRSAGDFDHETGARRASLGVVTLVFAAAITALVGGYVWVRAQDRVLRTEFQQEMQSLAQIHLAELASWRNERMADARVVYDGALFSGVIARALAAPDDADARATVHGWLAGYRARGIYDAAFVYDAAGLRLSEPAALPPPASALRLGAAEALRTGHITTIDLYPETPDWRPRMATLVPIRDARGATVAVLALRIDPGAWLYPRLQSWPLHGLLSEALLVRRDGAEVLYLNPLRYDPAAALRRRSPPWQASLLAMQGIHGRRGIVEGTDYLGRRALGFVAPVPDSPWLLVLRGDIDELDARRRRQFWLVGALDVLLLLSVGSAVAALSRAGRMRLYDKQRSLTRALVARENELHLALSAARQGLYDIDLRTGAAVTSPECATMLGYDPEHFRENRETWAARLHPDDRDDAIARFDANLATDAQYVSEFRLRTRAGEWRWIRTVGKVVARGPDGAALRMLGIRTDITDRKLAELRAERLARLYHALSLCNEAIVQSGDQAELFRRLCEVAVVQAGFAMAWVGMVDEATARVVPVASHGVGTEYLDGIEITTRDDAPTGRGPTGIALRERRPVVNPRFRSDGTTAPWRARGAAYGWASTAAFPLVLGGRAVGSLTLYSTLEDAFDHEQIDLLTEMASDISFALGGFAREARRIEAERRLAESEQRYRTLFDGSSVPTLVNDPATLEIVDANQAACAFYGWDRDTLRRMKITEISQVDLATLRAVVPKIRPGWTGHLELNHRLASGELRPVEIFSRGAELDGRVVTISTIVDLTPRKEAEAARAEVEQRYRDLVEHAPVAIFVSRADVVVLANSACARLFGVATPEALHGLSPYALIHPDYHDALRARARRPRDSGEPMAPVEQKVLRLDGRVVDVDLLAAPIGGDGDPALHVVLTDITERRQAERAIERSLREKEALLREVHHRVKNNLQVIASLLRLEIGRRQEPGVRAVLEEMMNRVFSMALLHETLYRSKDLGQIDLAEYLNKLCAQIFRALAPTTGAVRLRLELTTAWVELDQAMPCGLLVNELLSNSLKHGFPEGRSGEVCVSLSLESAGRALSVRVSDTGVGLPADFEMRKKQSLGLQLVSDLTRQLHGVLHVMPGPGSSFSMVFTPRGSMVPPGTEGRSS